jgi:phosphatidylserine decarboxylase
VITDYLKTLPLYLIPKQLLTVLIGLLANVKSPLIKNWFIKNWIALYQVNMQDALEEDPRQYTCFNDFFIRHLKPEKRPLAQASVTCPIDGLISQMGPIKKGQLIQAKGKYYSVSELLACKPEMSERFSNGLFTTLYLAPKDYHRIHMPIDATLRSMIYVPGTLFPVQPATARVIPKLFGRNERLVIFFDTELGLMSMVLVGATIVGAINTVWHGDIKRCKNKTHFNYEHQTIKLNQGDEMGHFKLGSTVVLLFANNELKWLEELNAGRAVQFGEALIV